MKTICIIPARGGSKGLANKNLRILNSKPLIYWPIKAAKLSGVIDNILVSTDSIQIAKAASQFGAEIPFLRESKYAEDSTPTEITLKDALLNYEKIVNIKYDICIFLTATDIFRSIDWIAEAVNILKTKPEIDSAFVVNKTTKNYWKIDKGNKPKRIISWMRKYSSRQIRNSIFREDTGLACASRSYLWREGKRIGENNHLIINNNLETFIDIHDEYDLFLAEQTIKFFKKKDPQRIKLFLDD